MKLIVQIVIVLAITCQFVLAQAFEESELKCSHAKTAKATLTNYSAPTLAQANYDVTFYDIDLEIDPAAKIISGTVGIEGKSTVAGLDMVELDLYSGYSIESVKNEHGGDLNFTHGLNLLSVTLDNPINSGNSFNIIIEYGGSPPSTGFGSFSFGQHYAEPMISTLSEPYGARDWWPCKDTPNDKADSVDISLKVPTGLIAASNGTLIDTVVNRNWTTYNWQERYPIATYLVSLAIHPYTVFYDWYKYSETDSMRLEYYVFPANYDSVQYTYGLTKAMIGAMAQRFGEYPFIKEKYGHAEFTRSGGMEHQTITSLGRYDEGLIAHELGHQWWGDMVTCANFHHIWLNEGLATYSEALWYEKRDNDIQSLHNEMALNRNWYGFRPGTIYVEDTTSVGSIFNGSLSYAKASWVVHMLRHVVGDSLFFKGIREYGDRYRFKSAVTEKFQTVMEEISGKDLEFFFERWIYGELYPIYEAVYNQSGTNLNLLISQTQASDVFTMPIDITAKFADGTEHTWVISNTERQELFELVIPNNKSIKELIIDSDNWILKKIGTNGIRLDTTGTMIMPKEFKLYPVYPNPFNPTTNIKFNVIREGEIIIRVNDIAGRTVWKKSVIVKPGIHSIKWNGIDENDQAVPSGTYFVKVSNGNLTKTKKMLLLK